MYLVYNHGSTVDVRNCVILKENSLRRSKMSAQSASIKDWSGGVSEVIIGVDLGGTKILAGLLTPEGRVLKTIKQPTPGTAGADEIMDRICASITELRALVSECDQLAGIAVGAPGPLYYPEGIISTTPNLGWKNVNLKKGLTQRLHREVIVENDGNMAALAEAHYGQKGRYRHLLYLTISTGIGGGIIIDGKIYRGRDGGAGEFGHMVIDPRGPVCGCGRHGCFEAMASGTALAREANQLLRKGQGQKMKENAADPNALTARDVSRAASSGDPEALALVNQLAQCVGMGISNLISIFNPEIVVLGGGVALGMGDILLKPVTEYIKTHTFTLHSTALPVVLSPLNQYAGLLGCAIAVNRR